MAFNLELFDDLFDNNFDLDKLLCTMANPMTVLGQLLRSATDIYETKNEYKIVMDLPGFKKNDVKIEADAESMEILVSKDNNRVNKLKNFLHLKERDNKVIVKAFSFPEYIDPSKAKVVLQDGMLTVTVPKAGKYQKVTLNVD